MLIVLFVCFGGRRTISANRMVLRRHLQLNPDLSSCLNFLNLRLTLLSVMKMPNNRRLTGFSQNGGWSRSLDQVWTETLFFSDDIHLLFGQRYAELNLFPPSIVRLSYSCQYYILPSWPILLIGIVSRIIAWIRAKRLLKFLTPIRSVQIHYSWVSYLHSLHTDHTVMAAKVVIISCSSCGIGLASALILAKDIQKRFRVYVTMRNLEKKRTASGRRQNISRGHVDNQADGRMLGWLGRNWRLREKWSLKREEFTWFVSTKLNFCCQNPTAET